MKKSNINLKYRLDRASLKDSFNRIMDVLLASNNFDVEEYNFKVKLAKKTKADIAFDGKKVLVNFPLLINAEKETIIQKLQIQGEIHIAAVCEIDIDENWELHTNTALANFYWIEKPKVKMGILNLSIEKIMNLVIEKAKVKVIDQIDSTIKEKIDLRTQIISVMNLVNRPIKFNNLSDVELSINIDIFSMTGVSDQVDWTEGIISVSGISKIRAKKEIENQSKKLPHFYWLNNEFSIDTSDLFFYIDLDLENINKIAKEKFVGKIFSNSGKEIKIVNLEIKGAEEKLGIVADVEGSYNGQIFLSAIPEYDKETRNFVSNEVEINLLTKNVLHKGLAWMLKGRIKNELTKAMQFSLEDVVGPIRSELDKQLAQINSTGQYEFKAAVQDLEIDDFKFSSQGIYASIHLPMMLEVKVVDLNSLLFSTVGLE